MNKKALSTMMAVFLVLAIGAVGYVIGTSSGATGYTVKPTNVDSSNICRYGEKQCGFAPKSKFEITCMQYANENWLGNINGDEYCKQQGFQFCSQGFWVVQNNKGPDSYMPFSCGQKITEGTGDFDYTKYNSYPNFEVEDVITLYTCCNVK